MNNELAENESDLLALLERYMEELQAGRLDRDHWRVQHPQFADRFDCLDRLDALAPTADPAATIPPRKVSPSSADLGLDDRFVLLEELGRGGMGVVFKARQSALDRVVALKMVLAGSLATEDQLRRFRAEAQAAAKIQHPHIVPIYETGQINGLPYLVMQLVEGCSLADKLKAGPMSATEAARCVATIARAMSALHAAGIVHRDLKPSNILLDGSGRPYVTDFGLAKLLEGENAATQTGAILGTPQYMAPEQALGHSKNVGPVADIYSLGAILFACLTSRPPFQEATAFDTVISVLEGEPPRPRSLNPTIPRVLEDICLQCLEKDPTRRFASADELATELEHFLKGEPVATRHSGVFDAVRRWARREPALASRLAALAVVSAIVQILVKRQPDLYRVGWQVQLLFVLWAAASWLCQRELRRPQYAVWAATIWSAADVVFLTAVQLVAHTHVSPIVVGYPFFIAASGLWMRLRLVWITTAFSVLGYAGLVLHERASNAEPEWIHRHLIFVAALIVLGFVMAYQVQRVRALSRYYEPRG